MPIAFHHSQNVILSSTPLDFTDAKQVENLLVEILKRKPQIGDNSLAFDLMFKQGDAIHHYEIASVNDLLTKLELQEQGREISRLANLDPTGESIRKLLVPKLADSAILAVVQGAIVPTDSELVRVYRTPGYTGEAADSKAEASHNTRFHSANNASLSDGQRDELLRKVYALYLGVEVSALGTQQEAVAKLLQPVWTAYEGVDYNEDHAEVVAAKDTAREGLAKLHVHNPEKLLQWFGPEGFGGSLGAAIGFLAEDAADAHTIAWLETEAGKMLAVLNVMSDPAQQLHYHFNGDSLSHPVMHQLLAEVDRLLPGVHCFVPYGEHPQQFLKAQQSIAEIPEWGVRLAAGLSAQAPLATAATGGPQVAAAEAAVGNDFSITN